MPNYTVTVYSGQYKEERQIEARNQDNLRQRVEGLGYDRVGNIRKVN